ATIKSLSKKMMSYMFLSEIIAVTIAICLFNILKPGVGGSPDLIVNGQPYEHVNHQTFGFTKFFLSIFPNNIFYSLTNFELLPSVIFSIMFGLGCTLAGEVTKPLIHLAISIREASTKCLRGVMLIAPFGIFALLGS